MRSRSFCLFWSALGELGICFRFSICFFLYLMLRMMKYSPMIFLCSNAVKYWIRLVLCNIHADPRLGRDHSAFPGVSFLSYTERKLFAVVPIFRNLHSVLNQILPQPASLRRTQTQSLLGWQRGTYRNLSYSLIIVVYYHICLRY